MNHENLKESDINFLKRHETHFYIHQELTTRFLSLIREYPNYRRDDFSNAFGKTLNYVFGKRTDKKQWHTNILRDEEKERGNEE